MHRNETIEALPREELLELVKIYAKNWLAVDGYWFQSVERAHGMDAAMAHDVDVWRGFTRTEARRIKAFLGLPEQAGLEGLARAMRLRLYASINPDEVVWDGEDALLYRTLECRVQKARTDKGLPLHPCKQVGVVEFGGFAKEIDARIECECVSCYPDITDESCNCVWRFTLKK